MKRRRDARLFKEKDDAVAGIVVAVMIVGLIIAVISVVQTIYVPKWMEQIESEHMDDVEVLVEQSTPISTPITLGNKELPFLVSSKAFGDLAVLDDQFSFKIEYDTGANQYGSDVIRYVSENAYYLDQSYIYEAGALILSQSDGNVMTMKPIFYAEKDESSPLLNKFNITFTMVEIEGKGDKTTVSGYGTYPIQTQYDKKTVDDPFTDIEYIEIITAYPLVWQRFINDTLKNSGMEYGQDDHYTVSVVEAEGVLWSVTIDILEDNCKVELFFTRSIVSAQIAPGWVE